MVNPDQGNASTTIFPELVPRHRQYSYAGAPEMLHRSATTQLPPLCAALGDASDYA
jgi:hypothetical protein